MISSNLLGGMPNSNGGLLRVLNNAQLDMVNQQRMAEQNPMKAQIVSGLAAHIRRCWSSAKDAKQEHQRTMLRSLRLRKGEYEAEIAAMIRAEGGSDIYMRLTDVKCRAAEAWIADIMLNIDELFSLEPTEIPELDPQQEQAMIQQAMMLIEQGGYTPEEAEAMFEEAKAAITQQMRELSESVADRMKQKIQDQFQEAEFRALLDEVISDVVTFKAGIIKGPMVRRKQVLSWDQTGGKFRPVVSEELAVDFQRLSPFDAYPAPYATDFDDGYFIARWRLTSEELYAMQGQRGNDDEAIRRVLDLYGQNGLNDWLDTLDNEREQLEGKHGIRQHSHGDNIVALEYRGPAQGKLLIEWGIDPQRIDDPLRTYNVEAWLVNHEVIRCVLNGDPLGRKPFSKASAVALPGSFWGMGVAEQMEDIQRMCNAAARALADNMAIASGPQVAIGITGLPDGFDITNIRPWKIWQLLQSENGQVPVHFFQPSMHANELLEIYERFARMADEVTGIPAYAYGSDLAAGAGKTASGLSMLMSNASKGIKRIISNIDKMVADVVHRTYIHNMLYDPDNSIKGDVKVVARGALALLQKEAIQARRMEMLAFTNNPTDLGILGLDGRADMLRDAMTPLDYQRNPVPDRQELQQRMMAQQQQEQQALESQEQAA